MMATENFLKHDSYSSKKGGFRVVVNGLLVHKDKVYIEQGKVLYASAVLSFTSIFLKL